jgi:D-alanyl-lipoteichoic acid acyltransferase DltB (MBOAT superfamily)
MNFAEVRFWELFFSGIVIIALLCGGASALRPGLRGNLDKICLLSLGLFLLLCVSWITFVIFLVVAVVSYLGLKWILAHHKSGHEFYLLILIPLQLAPLFYYKYADFAANHVLHLHLAGLENLIIPVGISFYSFQKVAFVVDTLAFKEPLPGFLDYMNFAGFFPQIVAGPIERRDDLLPQMQGFRFRWNRDNINDGVSWIVVGLFFKCCLADNLAALFSPDSTTNAYLIWIANLMFGLRIYYDFAGYSLVAVGLARCLGIRLTLNFASPYCSTSVTEFWRRWHITLSQWFRDYIYIPMGGGRTRLWAFNIAVVFVISGIWHGAGWNFFLWGALHGFFLIMNRMIPAKFSFPRVCSWFTTMVVCFYAWLCFYETHTRVLLTKMKTLLIPSAYSLSALRAAPGQWIPNRQSEILLFTCLIAVVLTFERLSVTRKNEPYYFFRRPAVLALLIVLTLLLAPGTNNGFIYFAF